jgi:hypothetical protein
MVQMEFSSEIVILSLLAGNNSPPDNPLPL